MYIFKNKKFRTLIITKKYIILIICFLILSIIFISTSPIYKKNVTSNYLCSNDFHDIILSSQLHYKNNNESFLKKVILKFLGFDIKKPETLLLNYHDFVNIDYEYNPLDAVYPKPLKSEQSIINESNKINISEISQSKGMAITNATDIKIDINKMLSEKLEYSLDDNGPQILIVHTHTTESYTNPDPTKYTAQDTNRTTDEEKNITAVGKILKETLEKNGLNVIHDTTVHDYPSYSGAYNRSKATVLNNLNKYPGIKLVLDVHRDGITKADGTKVKVACDIDNKKVAQCMFVVGSNVSLVHDNWQENMKLAIKLQNLANKKYPDLMRPINLREERFNQQLSQGALIIEVGSNGNTLEEAKEGIRLIGEVISEFFNNM